MVHWLQDIKAVWGIRATQFVILVQEINTSWDIWCKAAWDFSARKQDRMGYWCKPAWDIGTKQQENFGYWGQDIKTAWEIGTIIHERL